LVEKDLHAREEGGQSRDQALLGVTKHKLDLLACHSWKPLQEIINPRSALEVFKQGANRHTRALEQPFAADFAGYAFNRGTFGPIQHAMILWAVARARKPRFWLELAK
jgi:hypothetical protein